MEATSRCPVFPPESGGVRAPEAATRDSPAAVTDVPPSGETPSYDLPVRFRP